MKEKPIFKLLVSMSIPVVLSMLIQSLYNIVDSIWVTKLSTEALTAVSLAFPLQNAIMAVGVGIGVGIGSIISMNLGSKNHLVANKAASTGVALVMIHCLVFVVFGIFFTKPFLKMFTNDPYILNSACEYTYIVLCLSFGNLIQMGYEKIFQSVGRMKTTMLLMASGGIINMILDPILIFGWFNLPALGVKGAAIATVIGQIVAMILYLIVYYKQDIGVKLSLQYVKFDKKLIFQIYSIGIPSSLMLAMPSLLTGLLNSILTKFGNVYVAVFGLYFKLQTFVNMPSNGVIQGMRPIISYNYGAKEYQRVKKTIIYSLMIVFVVMIIGTIGAIFFPKQILTLFDADKELMISGITAFRIIGCSFILSTVGIVASGVFEALARGKDSLIISLLRQLIIIVPVGWLLSNYIGVNGIWIAFPVAEFIATVVSIKKLKDFEKNALKNIL